MNRLLALQTAPPHSFASHKPTHSFTGHRQTFNNFSLQFSGNTDSTEPDTVKKPVPRWKRRALRAIKTMWVFAWSGIMLGLGGVAGTIAYVADRHQLKPTELGYRETQEKIFLASLGHKIKALEGDTTGMLSIEDAIIYHNSASKDYQPNWKKHELKKLQCLNLPLTHGKNPDTLSLETYYKPAKKGYPTLVIVHGQTQSIELSQKIVRDGNLLDQPYGVIIYSGAGYGKSGGEPSQESLTNSLHSVLDYLNVQGIPDNRIAILGCSLGGGVTANTIKDRPDIAGVILASTFQNGAKAFSGFQEAFKIPAKEWLSIEGKLLQPYPSDESIRDFSGVMFFVGDTGDTYLPFYNMEGLFNAAQNARCKQLIPISGAGHDWKKLSERLAPKIVGLLEQIFK